MSKSVLFVDGSNVYAGQYQLVGPHCYLYFPAFINQLEKELGMTFSHIYYYASYSPQPIKSTKSSLLYLKNEGLFYKTMRKVKNSTFFKGYRSLTSGKEKEVDVKMAVDIVDLAHKNKYDHAVIMSGDADFMHALKIASALKKLITVVALENRIPMRFIYNYPTVIAIRQVSQRVLPSAARVTTFVLNKSAFKRI